MLHAVVSSYLAGTRLSSQTLETAKSRRPPAYYTRGELRDWESAPLTSLRCRRVLIETVFSVAKRKLLCRDPGRCPYYAALSKPLC